MKMRGSSGLDFLLCVLISFSIPTILIPNFCSTEIKCFLNLLIQPTNSVRENITYNNFVRLRLIKCHGLPSKIDTKTNSSFTISTPTMHMHSKQWKIRCALCSATYTISTVEANINFLHLDWFHIIRSHLFIFCNSFQAFMWRREMCLIRRILIRT